MFYFFFFNDTATTEIYTLSLHDALPICRHHERGVRTIRGRSRKREPQEKLRPDRKSTRLNSSHSQISYAVFCLKKKKRITEDSNVPLTTPRLSICSTDYTSRRTTC